MLQPLQFRGPRVHSGLVQYEPCAVIWSWTVHGYGVEGEWGGMGWRGNGVGWGGGGMGWRGNGVGWGGGGMGWDGVEGEWGGMGWRGEWGRMGVEVLILPKVLRSTLFSFFWHCIAICWCYSVRYVVCMVMPYVTLRMISSAHGLGILCAVSNMVRFMRAWYGVHFSRFQLWSVFIAGLCEQKSCSIKFRSRQQSSPNWRGNWQRPLMPCLKWKAENRTRLTVSKSIMWLERAFSCVRACTGGRVGGRACAYVCERESPRMVFECIGCCYGKEGHAVFASRVQESFLHFAWSQLNISRNHPSTFGTGTGSWAGSESWNSTQRWQHWLMQCDSNVFYRTLSLCTTAWILCNS